MVVAGGATPQVIPQVVLQRQPLGTYFSPQSTHLESRKRFLLAGMDEAVGELVIDRGAAKALQQGGSLLPVGINRVSGDFTRGQSVTVMDPAGREVAVGLSNYSADDIRQIIGQHSDQIEPILGYAYGAEVIHHNNLVLL